MWNPNKYEYCSKYWTLFIKKKGKLTLKGGIKEVWVHCSIMGLEIENARCINS